MRREIVGGLRKHAFVRIVDFAAGLQGERGLVGLRALEKSLNKPLTKLPAVLMCLYKVSDCSGSKILECVLESHPFVIYKGELYEKRFLRV